MLIGDSISSFHLSPRTHRSAGDKDRFPAGTTHAPHWMKPSDDWNVSTIYCLVWDPQVQMIDPAKLSPPAFISHISIINKPLGSFWLKGGSNSLHSRIYFPLFSVLWPSKNYCQLSVQLRDIDSLVAMATHELSGLCDSYTQCLICSSWCWILTRFKP